MKKESRLAMGIVALGMGAAVLGVTPANAQQSEPLLHEQLIEGVRGLFGKFFGGDSSPPQAQPAPASPPQVVQPAPPPAAAPQKAAEVVPVAVAAPSARVEGRSLHEAVVRGDLEATLKLLEQGTTSNPRIPARAHPRCTTRS